MKRVLFVIALAAISSGLAGTSYAQRYSACANNNSKHCIDARNAFAEHHGGVYPEQYYNHWYGGNPGRWTQQNNAWQWEGMNGDVYRRGDRDWEWQRYRNEEREEREHEHHDGEHEHHHHDHD